MIKIKTLLHPGINEWRKIRTPYEWSTGPRNLLKAARLLPKHKARMTLIYGNIGHQRSWIEIDGVEIYEHELMDLDPDLFMPTSDVRTRTEYARELIADIQSGELQRVREQMDGNANLI